MADLLASGRLVDFILLIVAVEAIVLIGYWRVTGKGIAPGDLLPNLVAGAMLLVALRLMIADADWMVVCASLAVAGIANMIDVSRRWRK